MILNEKEAKKLLLENLSAPNWVIKARAYHKKLMALFYGIDFVDFLVRYEQIESEKSWKARKQYGVSNIDINQKLIKPIDYIYNAVGGSNDYFGIKESDKEKFFKKIENYRGGKSIKQWLEINWCKNLYITDPNGVLFYEYDRDVECNITYKSITKIRNYKSNGIKLEWIIFEPVKEKVTGKEFYRIVDDLFDYTFERNGDDFILSEKTFTHPFGFVPAVINSDKEVFGTEMRLSPIHGIIDKQMLFMRERSMKTIYKIKAGLPLPYRVAMLCTQCQGTGTQSTAQGNEPCSHCGGNGYIKDKDVVDEIILPLDPTSNEINIPTSIGGYLIPDISVLEKYDKDENEMLDEMYDSLWGVRFSEETVKTATEIYINTQPKINKLNEWADVAQSVEEILTELLYKWINPLSIDDVCRINYGRIYLMETPDKIINRYIEAKKNNVAIMVLDRLILEYLTTKFKNDPSKLKEELLKKELEPFVHYSLSEINSIFGGVEAKKKMLFLDWWESLTESDYDTDVEVLRQKRDEFFINQINEYYDSSSKSVHVVSEEREVSKGTQGVETQGNENNQSVHAENE